MPIKIYRITPIDKSKEEIAFLCDDEWLLLPQIESLSEWVNKNSEDLPFSDYVADVGFCWRRNALAGGPVLDVPIMRKMVDIGMRLFLSEYPGFAGEPFHWNNFQTSRITSPTDYEEAVNRLWNHSNSQKSFDSEDESLIFCLYKAEQNNQPPQISSLVEDIIQCLEIVNKEFNGITPSETFGRANSAVLEQVSYPISGIIYSILDYYRSWKQSGQFDINILDALLDAVFKISLAWDQVLAGDVDDLLEGFEYT